MKEWAIKIGLSILVIFAPIKSVMLTAGVLIFTDMAVGMWAAKKRGEAITSAQMRRTISKLLVYQICLMTGYLLEINLLDKMIPITKLIGGVIGLTEMKSILENAKDITGVDIFAQLISKLGSNNDPTNPS